MIKFLYSRRLFALCVCASLSLFACSDEKDPPSHAELCNATPITSACLVGRWHLNEVENDNYSCGLSGNLELQASGGFHFTGGQYNLDVWGTWTFDNNVVSAFHNELGEAFTGSISVTNSGAEMRVTSSGQDAVFSLCNTKKNGRVEKFTWIGQ